MPKSVKRFSDNTMLDAVETLRAQP
jgi:hypothetical protein